MIKLNLLPEDLRKQKKDNEIDPSLLRKLFIIFVVVLASIHLLLIFAFAIKGIGLARLKRKLPQIEPKVAEIESKKKELSRFEANTSLIEQLIQRRINTAGLLYKISKYLPDGVWLDRIDLKEDKIYIEGKVASTKKDEVTLINKFLEKFQKDSEFNKNFKNLVLRSTNVVLFNTREVITFVLQGDSR